MFNTKFASFAHWPQNELQFCISLPAYSCIIFELIMQSAWKTDFVMQKARSNNNNNNYKKSSDTYNRFFDVFGVTSISNTYIKS